MLIGLYRWSELDRAGSIFWFYSCAGFLTEFAALFAARKYGNNMPIYSIYSLLEFGLIASYFNYSIDILRPYHIGWYIGITGIAIGIVNIIYLQPLTVLNSYFLYFEGIVILGLALFSFFRILLMSDGIQIYRLRHFWFSVILCFFWSITFFNWGLYGYFAVNERQLMWLINLSINIVSGITYLAIAVVFWKYPKLKMSGE